MDPADPRKEPGTDLTEGPVSRLLLRFTLPLFAGNLLQVAYGAVNRFWTGQFLGKEALGAVSIGILVAYVLVAFAWGMTMGATILVAQAYGAKDWSTLRKAVANSFLIVGLMALGTTFLMIAGAAPVLRWLGTPPELFGMARDYLLVGSLGAIFVFGFNLVSFIFRAIGDSTTPLKYLALSVGINTILDPFLMLGWGPFPRMGISGAAAGMVVAEGTAFLLSFRALQRKGGPAALVIRGNLPDWPMISAILRLGLPGSFQQTFISLGVSVIQRFINGFGSDAIAAYGAAANVDNLFFLPAISLNLAVSSMAGQNVGAGKLDRARMTAAYALLYSGAVSLALGILCLAVPSWLLSPFLQAADSGALAIGERLLRILGLPYLFITSMVVLNGFFNGVGDTLASMFLSIVSLWILRVPLVWRLSGKWGLDGVWAGIAAGYVLSLFLALGYYALGTWKRNLRRE